MEDIVCPHCGKRIELTEAITHQLSEKVRKEEKEKSKEEMEKVLAKERLIAQNEAKTRAKKEIEKANREKIILEQKLIKEEKHREDFEKKAKEIAQNEALKSTRLEKLEYEKRIKDMQIALEDAQRKSKQGSQQLQGEVLELDLEEKLKATFTSDEFLPIPKGVEGADIWQKVKLQGIEVGSIIWETKRTKEWRPIWLGKLKEDAARINASEAIIVSQVLPDNEISFDRKDNVWITNYEQAISIARFVRFLISALHKTKSSASQTDQDWEKVRDYMLSDAFKHRMQAHFDSVKNLRDMLDTEKRTSILRWTRQQKQIDKLDSNTVNFYAELKDIVHNLPELEELELTKLTSGDDEKEQETLI